MKKTTSKLLSLLLTLVMVIGLLPTAAFAAGGTAALPGQITPTTAETKGTIVVLYNAANDVIVSYDEISDYDVDTSIYTYWYIDTEAASVTGTELKTGFSDAGTLYVIDNGDGSYSFLDQYDYDDGGYAYYLATAGNDTVYSDSTGNRAFELISAGDGYLLRNRAEGSYFAIKGSYVVAEALDEDNMDDFIFQFAIWDGETDDGNIICTLVRNAAADHPKAGYSSVWSESFEGGIPNTWDMEDKDEDGHNWTWSKAVGTAANNPPCHGEWCAMSYSYDNDTRSPLTPDNWLYLPSFELAGGYEYLLTFMIQAQDKDNLGDNIGVFISTDGGASYEHIGEDHPSTVAWTEVAVDLSEYAGQTVNLAVVHHNSKDIFIVKLDCFNLWEKKGAPADDTVITSVAISDVTEPVVGEEAQFTGMSVPADANYSLNNIYWAESDALPTSFEEVDELDYWYNSNDAELEFKAGKYYIAISEVASNVGFTFGENAAATVNGGDADFVDLYDGYLYIYKVYGPLACAPTPTMIDSVEVSDTQIPAIDNPVVWDAPVLPTDADYELYTPEDKLYYSWVEHDDLITSYADLYDDGTWYHSYDDDELTFNPNKYYTLCIWVSPKYGFEFALIDDMTGKINGTAAQVSDYEMDEYGLMTLYRTFDPLSATPGEDTPDQPAISVTPETATVVKGGTQQFAASVTGLEDQSIAWSVTGGSSTETQISNDGLLTVAEDETAETLTIKARANAVVTFELADTATVTVIDPTTDVPIRIPIKKVVELGGTEEPGETIFEFEAYGFGGGEYNPNEDNAAEGAPIISGGVTITGEDTFEGAIILTAAEGDDNLFGNLSEGFYIREKPVDDARWSCDNKSYFVRYNYETKQWAVYEQFAWEYSEDQEPTPVEAVFTNYYTEIALPITKVVEKSGNVTPGEAEFTFNAYSRVANLIVPAALDVVNNVESSEEDTSGILGSVTIPTNGTGDDFKGKIVFGPYSRELVSGFYVSEVPVTDKDWNDDDAEYFVRWNGNMHDWEIYDAAEYDAAHNIPGTTPAATEPERLNMVSFTNTYTKNQSSGGGGGGGVTRYILTYESNGGTNYPNESYSYGTKVDLNKTPVREGYDFTGWYSDKGATNKITSVTMTSNKTVYAGWSFNGPLNTKDHVAYVKGYPDGTVGPNNNITRAETAVMLYRLLTKERSAEITTTENTFSDVSTANWYNTEVSSMAKGGYVFGYEDGTFGGDKSITRAEFVTMMVRFINPAEGTKTFTDVPTTHWAYKNIATATAAGWIDGYTDGSFGPDKFITRAEAMTIINRVLNRGVDEDSTLLNFKKWPDNKASDWFYYDVIEATNGHEYTGSRPSEDWTKLY